MIRPVWWLPQENAPATAEYLEDTRDQFGPDYRKYGLRYLAQLSKNRDQYQEFLVQEVPNPWKAGLLDRIAEFFRSPAVMFLLVTFGIFGLILEIKMPGTTIPGTVAALCFVLFFWAHSFVGQFTVLAALLFLLGVSMILVEIFFIPGFAFVGTDPGRGHAGT